MSQIGACPGPGSAGPGSVSQGFKSAATAQFLAPVIDNANIDGARYSFASRFTRVGIAALAGGIAAKLSGGNFADGARMGAFSRWFNDELHFYGEKLTWKDDDGNTLKEWDAVSGRDGYQDPKYQHKENYDPIPEGEYTFRDSQTWSGVSVSDKIISTVGSVFPGKQGA